MTPTATDPPRGRLAVLIVGQVLASIAVASGVAVGGLLAERVSGQTSMAGLAQTASVLGGALLAVPLASLAERRGRAPALSSGYLLALAGAVLVLTAARLRALPLLLVGMALFGAGTATGLQARYAAIDGVPAERRGRALSLVVWAGTVGGILGPNLSGLGERVGSRAGAAPLSGAFLFSVVAFAVATAVYLRLPGGWTPLRTTRADGTDAGGRLRDVPAVLLATPRALAGLAAMGGAHAAMVAVMVMTPVHIGHAGGTLRLVGFVISMHVAGMYALSPLSGLLTDRWGPDATIGLGTVVLWGAMLLAAGARGHDSVRLTVALTVLGLGWSLSMVAGSALLSSSVEAAVRTRVQGSAI